jgi:hypothetical protein
MLVIANQNLRQWEKMAAAAEHSANLTEIYFGQNSARFASALNSVALAIGPQGNFLKIIFYSKS